jgi:hypothetical protein
MELVYDLSKESERIGQMRRVTLETEEGLAAEPALVGSPDWWAAVEGGRLQLTSVEGRIADVFWGSMADWPEFTLETDDGERSQWTREGDVTRYVEGLRVRLEYVLHPWKKTHHLVLGPESKLTIRVWIEPSKKRSSGIAPGPGGIGSRIHRRRRIRRLLGPLKFLVRPVPR